MTFRISSLTRLPLYSTDCSLMSNVYGVQVMGLASPDDEAKLVREITDSGFRRALQEGVKHDPA